MKTRSAGKRCSSRFLCADRTGYRTTIHRVRVEASWQHLKTVKQEEPISRSRFADCPVCKNHTLKVKRTVQVGRCKSCNETYKIIVVYVKTGRKTKVQSLTPETRSENKQETKPEAAKETSLPSLQLPSDTSLSGTSSPDYSGLSEAVFGETPKEQGSESGQSSSQ